MNKVAKNTIANDAREGAAAAAEILAAAEQMLEAMAQLVAAQREYSRTMTMLAEQVAIEAAKAA